MNPKAIIPLVLGLAIGLLAVKFGVDTIKKARASGQRQETVMVVRAKMDLGAYEEITPESVEIVETTDNPFAPAGDRIESVDEIVGRVTSKAIPMNSPVLLSMLAPENTRPGMVGRIPPGFRAVSVKIDEVSGVAYQIQPGDWVDVIVVMDVETGVRGRKETVAEVILQHVEVAALGLDARSGSTEGPSTGKPARSVTLLVSEGDVPKLHLAATRGKVTLSMRGEDARLTEAAPSAHMSGLLASMGKLLTPPGIPGKGVQPRTKPPQEHPDRELTAEESEDPEPHTVTVYRRSTTGPSRDQAIERITFESADSPNILEVAEGAPTRAAAVLSTAKKTRGSRYEPD